MSQDVIDYKDDLSFDTNETLGRLHLYAFKLLCSLIGFKLYAYTGDSPK